MTAFTIQIVYFLFFIEACTSTQSYSTPDFDRRHLPLPRHRHEVEQYSIFLLKIHKLCSSCADKNGARRELARLQRDANPAAMHKSVQIRTLGRHAENNYYENQFANKKHRVRRHIHFISPIGNLITDVNSIIKNMLYGVPSSNKKWTGPHRREQNNQRQRVVPGKLRYTPEKVQIKSTEAPISRKIRSTVTAEAKMTTPALPPTTTVKELTILKTKTQTVTTTSATITSYLLQTGTQTLTATSVTATPYLEMTAKVPDSMKVTRGLPSKTLTTELPNLSLMPGYNTSIIVPDASYVSNRRYATESDMMMTIPLIQQISQALNTFERKFYTTTFRKLSAISPLDRRENGISFVVSGFFLFLVMSALSMEVDKETKNEIESSLALDVSDTDKIRLIKRFLDGLPPSSDELKFRWSTRIVVNGSWHPSRAAGQALRLHIETLAGSETAEQLLQKLNYMVEQDSGGAMRDTFEEDEVANGVRAVLINTLYLRARWRVAPTLLNDSRPFRDADGAPPRTTRMVRINDAMRYADLTEWDAQAVEISYATPGLSLFLIVPRGRSLRRLSEHATSVSINDIITKMQPLRVAISLPIFTLRMTLLLPNKLQAMGISRLVTPSTGPDARELRLSHAVQRMMFWAEAGRNAFKDDGIEWDLRPDLEIMVDRPYIFYVRWHNLTLLNGNFVL